PVWATDVTGNCPAGGFTQAGSPWNLTGGVTVPVSTTCTVQAGVTINGHGHGISVNGTFNAIGTSSAARDVVLNDLVIVYQPAAMGTLQFCTMNALSQPYAVLLRGAQTLNAC